MQAEAIYKGATRPAMKLGIPLVPLVVLFGTGMLLIMWGGTLLSWWIAPAWSLRIVPALAVDALRHRQGRPALPADVRRRASCGCTTATGASGTRAATRPTCTGEPVMLGMSELGRLTHRTRSRRCRGPLASRGYWAQRRCREPAGALRAVLVAGQPARRDHPRRRLPARLAARRRALRMRRRAADRRAPRGAVQPAAQPGRRPVGGVDASAAPRRQRLRCSIPREPGFARDLSRGLPGPARPSAG